ncbi:MAG: Asp-tRNA(Asn)/Glu-tRNA(Gln) amidotransferase subunit GatC [Candidatus Aenigmarchaeota archaeon]|nr:Asp-tRNA(Asn)/Glu-tRNA(Gln) amidotransferase subunit GatC [Candidatus Aenigmarchaeota archaeon]
MVAIDKKTVKKVAGIARLNLTEGELRRFSEDLVSVLDAFNVIGKVSTKDVRPTFQPVDIKNVAREDKIEPCIPQREALANTGNKEEGHFKGPKVV